MIAREDKGVVGGVDYNRSPTVYFQTNCMGCHKGNMTKVPESDTKGSAIGRVDKIQKYCDLINNTSADLLSSNNYFNSLLGGSKIVSTILHQISRRLNSLEELFFVSICLSRYKNILISNRSS